MSEPSDPKQLCVDCRKEIPFGAKKCTVCGSYQDFRRFLATGQSSLALVISITALVAVIASGWETAWRKVDEWRAASIGPISSKILEIDDFYALVLIENNTSDVVVARQLACFLVLHMDNEIWNRERLTANRFNDWPPKDASIGSFFLGYYLPDQILIPPSTTTTLMLFQKHMSGPIDNMASNESNCLLNALSPSGEDLIADAKISPADLGNFDVLELLKRTDLSNNEQKRALLIEKVQSFRSSN